jgi:hypothetical protein
MTYLSSSFKLLSSLALAACLLLSFSGSAHALGDGSDFDFGSGESDISTGVTVGMVITVPLNTAFSAYDLIHLEDDERSETAAFVEVAVMSTEMVVWSYAVYQGLAEEDNVAAGLSLGMATWSALLAVHGMSTLATETEKPAIISVGGQDALVAPTVVSTGTNTAPGLGLFGRF